MTDEEMAVKYVREHTGFNVKEPLGKIAVRTYLAGAASRIIELEKEKKKLLESVEGATAMYKDLQEARMRIERLKNCANCRQCSASHAGYPYWCLGREIEVTGYDRCNDWEEEK